MNGKYDEDEILILAGKFADEFTNKLLLALKYKYAEDIRNEVADRAEGVMRSYPGNEVPLPEHLLSAMGDAGRQAAAGKLVTIIFNDDLGGE